MQLFILRRKVCPLAIETSLDQTINIISERKTTIIRTNIIVMSSDILQKSTLIHWLKFSCPFDLLLHLYLKSHKKMIPQLLLSRECFVVRAPPICLKPYTTYRTIIYGL